ncbi:MCE family protein [Streptomyces polyrhachis]|uniref:MCE family protein n=1 Tax=Streptomyces polyrhachis TaxID=1282885 RepID=A0ABW2GHT9_9ACTN
MTGRSLAGPLVKSLIFIVLTGLATAVLAISVAQTSLDNTTTYKAWFTDTTGLIEGDSVRAAGVKVGQVDSIKVVNRRYAEVTFSVERQRALPATTTAAIKYLNMVGQRFVDLDRGAGTASGVLAAGDTIPLKRTMPSLDLTQLFNGFQPLMRGLSPKDTNKLAGSLIQVLQGEGGTVTSLMEVVGSLTTTLAAKDQVIGQVIDNLNTVLKTVNDREDHFTELVGTLQQVITGFAEDRHTIGAAVHSMSELAVSTADLFEESRPALKDGIHQLGQVSQTMAANTTLLESFLQKTPQKMRVLTRAASYGSWLNLYLCEAKVTGVTTYDGSPPPTGIAIKDGRCRS